MTHVPETLGTLQISVCFFYWAQIGQQQSHRVNG